MKQLSIIVPIYNVEKYIRMCLESFFRQEMDEETFEVILVNDGTPDKSMEVISDIIEAHQNIHVINQENQGLSMARNNGMEIATGEYILFVDSDDLLIDNSLSFLLSHALTSKADIIVADYTKMHDEQIAQIPITPIIQEDGYVQKKTGKELLLQDLNPYSCYVWRSLFRSEFLRRNNLRFIPNICFEDIPFAHQCYTKANLCLRVNWKFIIYRKGHVSISSYLNKKKGMDYCVAISETWNISKEDNFDEQIITKLRNDTFIHYSMLIYYLTSNASISRSEKMYILNYLKQLVPDLSFKNGVKQRTVNFLYHRLPSTYMTLRIFYANYLQDIFWKIGDTIRNKQKD